MIGDEELDSVLAMLRGEFDAAELDWRMARFRESLCRLRDDPAEAARIDAIVTDAWLEHELELPARAALASLAELLPAERARAMRGVVTSNGRPERPLVAAFTSSEQPTAGAELKIVVVHSRVKITARRWSVEGTVPSAEAHHLITTFGILGSIVSGLAGAILTLRIASGLPALAFAELGLALLAAVLIAVRSRRSVQRAARSDEGPTPPRDAG